MDRSTVCHWRTLRTTSLLAAMAISTVWQVDLPVALTSPNSASNSAPEPASNPAPNSAPAPISEPMAAPISVPISVPISGPFSVPSLPNSPLAPAADPAASKEATQSQPDQHLPKLRVASLGHEARDTEATLGSRSPLAEGPVHWAASSGCLNAQLRRVVNELAASFGPVTVKSTCRSRRHNAAVGGAHHSYHMGGNAADFRLRGNVRGALAFLSSLKTVGGFKHYRDGHFHIDSGPRRSW